MTGLDCEKGYPKEFRETTVVQDNGYPLYRRRAGSSSCCKGGLPIDARDVVPYNPYLSRLLQCHLNVEFCRTVRSVKYLYKYTFKGHDRATIELDFDEVRRYLDTRYVGPPEACWRLLEFPLHDRSHVICRLAVHELNQQVMVFEEGSARAALHNHQTTTLLAWFQLNVEDSEARDLLYTEIPEHYRYDKKEGKWVKRQRKNIGDKVIGRLHSASPTEQGRFYLYLLLLHTRGAIAYSDLCTFGGREYASFRLAAEARGLVESDAEYSFALQEAASLQHPSRLRQLFAYILLNCEVSDPAGLWDQFRDDLSEDFSTLSARSDDRYDIALQSLQALFERVGKKTTDFELPLPTDFDAERFQNRDLFRETEWDVESEEKKGQEMQSKLYPAQRAAFHDIMQRVNDGVPAFFFRGRARRCW